MRIGHKTGESQLLKRAKSFDEAALAELYDRYAPKAYAYIYRRVSDPVVAEDLTSDLFLRVVRAILNEHTWKTSFQAWLYRIAHNLVVDHYRRQPDSPAVPLDESLITAQGNPVTLAEASMDSEQLRAALFLLTPEQQEVLALRFGEGLTAREVGEILDKSTGAVEALQRRGIAALKRILAGDK